MEYNSLIMNPVLQRAEERDNSLPEEILQRVKAVLEEPVELYQLKKIAKRRTKVCPETGMVFVMEPSDGLFFLGQVIEASIQTVDNDCFVTGNHLIVVFQQVYDSPDVPFDSLVLDYQNLLLRPLIIPNGYWTRGFFKDIGKKPVPKFEALNCGFWSAKTRRFETPSGLPYTGNLKYMGYRAITTITGLGCHIKKELIIRGLI